MPTSTVSSKYMFGHIEPVLSKKLSFYFHRDTEYHLNETNALFFDSYIKEVAVNLRYIGYIAINNYLYAVGYCYIASIVLFSLLQEFHRWNT